jgi:hypothetical protein
MPKELVAKPFALMRALDKPRDIGHHKGLVALALDNPQVRLKGRKGIIRNLRASLGKGGHQGGFPRVRETNQTNISDQLEAQAHITLFSEAAWLTSARHSIGRRLKLGIPLTALAASSNHEGHLGLIEILQDIAMLRIQHNGSDRDLDHEIITFAAEAI